MILLTLIASIASANTVPQTHVYAFGTKIPIAAPVKNVTALPVTATAVPVVTPLPIVRTSSSSLAPTLPPVITSSTTIIPAIITSTTTTQIPITNQVPVDLPSSIPATSSSSFIPPLTPAAPVLTPPAIPNVPAFPTRTIPVVSSQTLLNSNVPTENVREIVDEVVPTTTLPLTAPDHQAIRVPDATTVSIPTTELPVINRGIFSNVNAKFRDRINALIAEIVDDVIEQTKNNVQTQIHSLG